MVLRKSHSYNHKSDSSLHSADIFPIIGYYSISYITHLMFIVIIGTGLIDHIELNSNKDILFRSNKYPVRIDCKVNSDSLQSNNGSLILDGY